jgi:hypothetical protein
MRISNQNQMPQNANLAQAQENKEMERAAGHKSFRLTVTGNPPKVSTDEIRRMLSSARASTSYKANFQKYQFKLNGQELTLKQQGLFSRFKGLIGFHRDVREARRADAAKLIGDAFEREDKKLGADEKIFEDQMTNAESIKFQRDVMNHSDVSPKARELRTSREPVAPPFIGGRRNDDVDSGPITFNDLMTGELEEPSAAEERRDGNLVASDDLRSFEAYNSEVDAPKDSLIRAKRPRASEGNDHWLKEERSLDGDYTDAGRDPSKNSFLENLYKNPPRSSNGSLVSQVSQDSQDSQDSKVKYFRLLADH